MIACVSAVDMQITLWIVMLAADWSPLTSDATFASFSLPSTSMPPETMTSSWSASTDWRLELCKIESDWPVTASLPLSARTFSRP